MEDTPAIQTLKDICSKNKIRLLAVLKTPNVGQKVEGMNDIGYELPEYSIIYESSKDRDLMKLNQDFYELDKRDDGFNVQNFDIDQCESFQSMIDNLKNVDGYEVIWRDPDYTDKSNIASVLKPEALSYEVKIHSSYELLVFYGDLVRYNKEVNNKDKYLTDLFVKALKAHPKFDEIVGNSYYPLDVAKLDATVFTDTGITFRFHTVFSTGDRKDSKGRKNFLDSKDVDDLLWKADHVIGEQLDSIFSSK